MKKYFGVLLLVVLLLSGCEEDLTAPVFEEVPEMIEINEGDDLDLLSLGIKAMDGEVDFTDNITVDVTDTTTLEIGTHEVIYKVSDDSNNEATFVVPLKVLDIEVPVLSTVEHCGFVSDMLDDIIDMTRCLTVTDNYDGDTLLVDNLIIDYNAVDIEQVGEYVMSVDYKDSHGNEAETLYINYKIENFTDKNLFLYVETEDGTGIKILSFNTYAETEVIIPTHIDGIPVVEIASAAFSGRGLEYVTIPDTVVEIGSNAFFDNLLVSIELPSSLKVVGERAFMNGNRIDVITIPEGTLRIEEDAFAINFSSEINLPESLVYIGTGAFQAQEGSDIYIGPNVEYCEGAFMTAQGSTMVDGEFVSIGRLPFSYDVHPDNQYYTSVDGILFNKDMTIILDYAIDGFGETYTIPDNVTEIGENAFALKVMHSVIIPDSVTTLRRAAFSNATFEELRLPSTITYMEELAIWRTDIKTCYYELELDPFTDYPRATLSYINAEEFIVNEGNPYFKTIDGVLFTTDNYLVRYTILDDATSYVVPEGTVGLLARSFSMSKIESLTIASTVVELEEEVFFIGEIYVTEVIVLGDNPTRLNDFWADAYLPIDQKPTQ